MTTLLSIVSTLRLGHPGYGLAEIGILVGMFCATLLVAASRNLCSLRFDQFLLIAIIALTLSVIVQETAGVLANLALQQEYNFTEMLIHFSHPRFFNQLQSSMIPMLAAVPFVFHKHAPRSTLFFCVVLIGFQWCLLLVSGGRGSVLSVSIAVFAVGAIAWRASHAWLMINVGGALVGGTLFSLLTFSYKLHDIWTGDLLANSLQRSLTHTTGRYHFWQHAFSEALQQPFLGLGTGRFQCGTSMAWPAHPHNAPLQFLAEWGFPATVLLLAIFLLAAIVVIKALLACKSRDTADSGMLLSVATAALATGLHANLSGVLIMPASQMMAILTCGCLLSLTTEVSHVNRRAPVHMVTVWFIALGISSTVAWFATTELTVINARTSTKAGELGDFPRFWRTGQSCSYTYRID
jgi:O-antigen ligase